MEIEKKFIIPSIPPNLNTYPHSQIKQGYLSTSPVIRIRQQDDTYILTLKGKGLLQREEFELPIDADQFKTLSLKIDGILIHKTRYYIPYEKYTIELDCFHDEYEHLVIAEVEFDCVDDANTFQPPCWFGKDVTFDPAYHNSSLSQKN